MGREGNVRPGELKSETMAGGGREVVQTTTAVAAVIRGAVVCGAVTHSQQECH